MATTETPTPVGGDITIQDFDSIVRVIDVVTQRGAFRGEELASIGALREKFSAAVQQYVQQQEQAQGAASAPASDVTMLDDAAAQEVATTSEKSLKKK
jgi:hypothetical protein